MLPLWKSETINMNYEHQVGKLATVLVKINQINKSTWDRNLPFWPFFTMAGL